MTFGIPLFRKRVKPKPMPLALQPKAGEIYAHVFENPRTGVARNLFWNARIDFQSVELDGEKWNCSLGIEWLTWQIRNWQELDGMSSARLQLPDMLECSLYLFEEHHWATLRHLRLSKLGPSSFEADFSAIADVDDGSGSRQFEVSGKHELKFTGIILVPVNFQPQPTNSADAEVLVSEFIGLEGLKEPKLDKGRYILEPASG